MKQLLFALLLFSGSQLYAQSGADEKAVAGAVEALRKALVDPSKATLEKLTSPNLSYGHSNGNLQDQAAFVDALVSGSSDFVSVDLSNQTIKITGNVAVVRHTLTATTNDAGKPGNTKLSVLQVWIKQNREWKLLARQAVKTPV